MSDQTPSQPGIRTNFRVVSVFAAFALVALFIYLMVVAEDILLPFVIAVFIVILLDSLAIRLSKYSIKGRRLPDWLCMTISILVFIGTFVLLANLIRSNINAVNAALPEYETNIRALLDKGLALVGARELPSVRDLIDQIDVGQTLGSTVSALAAITGNTLTVLFYVAFILLEQVTFGRKVDALFQKTDDRKRARAMVDRVTKDIQTYIGLKTFVSAITGILSYIVMALVGVDFAGFWAVLIFILNFIPYIGSLVGVAFPAVLTLVQFDSLIPFVITSTVLASVQLAVGNIIEPRMMGRSLNLSPLVILLSLAIFGQIWGIVGMVLSMPFMVIAMIVCAGFEATRPVAIVLSATGNVDRRDQAT
ncbi:MAG TPA: AI-2E family transporter [Rhodospirillaceae bacterium]|nr:permease [Rhodospirillaceae bacterium]MAX63052.1 permease [Rhodospirillaceae bacterium]MBB57900.1 permease [Rhodospirillaceae bacterium]HAE02408.1 AI-2E family transporter [Rhodospirillaceae bacterium]HAJ21873.1 AI-2E family transporter [Rhodospirillaceae bacterium]|tara:strand:- start:27051 stop:28142 length:1092 start_codon:yes stop_codon:yes gene_type:complete